jgi:hypothetical protein
LTADKKVCGKESAHSENGWRHDVPDALRKHMMPMGSSPMRT